jgi:hypothetical protein
VAVSTPGGRAEQLDRRIDWQPGARREFDPELRLNAAVPRSIREHGGERSSRHVGELLDERLARYVTETRQRRFHSSKHLRGWLWIGRWRRCRVVPGSFPSNVCDLLLFSRHR